MVKKPFIVIGIPIGLDFKIDLRLSVWATTMCERGNVVIKYEATRFCSEGMNKIIHYVLKHVKSATHLLLLNADEVPTRHDVLDLLLAADKDIVVGAVPIVFNGIFWKVSHYAGGKLDGIFKPIPYAELPKQLFRAFDSGTPYLIKRKVLEEIEWPYFFDLWDSKTSERTITQDLYFSRKATEYGFEIWCEPRAVFEHYKCVGLKRMADFKLRT